MRIRNWPMRATGLLLARNYRRHARPSRQTRDHFRISAGRVPNVREKDRDHVSLGETGENGQVVKTSPAEVVIDALHVSPVRTLAEDLDVLAVVRLVDELRIRRQCAKIGNIAPNDRDVRPDHGDASRGAD